MSLFRNPEESRIANILLNKGCLATTMFLIFHKEWGEEFLGWESETLDREIEDTFHIRIPSENLDKIEALASALVSDSFYRDWAAFSVICQSLSGGEIAPDPSDPITAEEMVTGVVEVLLNDTTPATFSPEVCRFVGIVLSEQGFIHPPKPLWWADIPSRYIGSDTAADQNQFQAQDTEHLRIVNEVARDTGLLLLKQASLIPFVSDEQLKEMVKELSSSLSLN